MNTLRFSDFDLYKFGNELQFVGCILEGDGRVLLMPFPDQNPDLVTQAPPELLVIDSDEWVELLRQTDSGDVRTMAGVILRKGQRQVDSNISWRVYERDDFRCRYCGARKPLTVDHLDLWEDGGATVEENLVSSCRHCNKTRGNTPYEEWLQTNDYRKRAGRLKPAVREANEALAATLPHLRTLRTTKARTR